MKQNIISILCLFLSNTLVAQTAYEAYLKDSIYFAEKIESAGDIEKGIYVDAMNELQKKYKDVRLQYKFQTEEQDYENQINELKKETQNGEVLYKIDSLNFLIKKIYNSDKDYFNESLANFLRFRKYEISKRENNYLKIKCVKLEESDNLKYYQNLLKRAEIIEDSLSLKMKIEINLDKNRIRKEQRAKEQSALLKAQKENEDRIKADEEKQRKRYNRLVSKYGKAKTDLMEGRKVVIGWTADEVIESWGRPSDINRTTTQYHVSEQWVYGLGMYLYFEDGILTVIQN